MSKVQVEIDTSEIASNTFYTGFFLEGALYFSEGRGEDEDPYCSRQPAFSGIWLRGWRAAKKGDVKIKRI